MAIYLSSQNSGYRSLAHSGCRYNDRMNNRINELLKERGWQNSDLADRIGAHTTTVSRLINGRILLSEPWLVKLSRAFGVPPSEILAPRADVRMITVASKVEAGLWAESLEIPIDDQYEVPIPDDPAYRHLRLFAAETHGPSMNKRYPPGTVIIFNDQAETGSPLEVGKRYVVRRERNGSREDTVKTLWRDKTGRYWLLPESTDPLFQEPLSLDPDDGDVTIIGRVIWSVQRE